MGKGFETTATKHRRRAAENAVREEEINQQRLAAKRRLEAKQAQRERTVAKYDKDGSETLERQELHRLLKDSVDGRHEISREDVEYYLNTCDKDQSGGIDAKELGGLLYHFH